MQGIKESHNNVTKTAVLRVPVELLSLPGREE
jgi:hypothetical protein